MLRCWSIAYSSAMRTGSLVVISVVAVLTTSLLVVAAMNASSVVGEEEKKGGLWCSPIANTSIPTSSVFCAICTIASIRSASLGVSPETGSRVMSLTEKIPNCMSCLSCAAGSRTADEIYAFACISAARAAGIFPGTRRPGFHAREQYAEQFGSDWGRAINAITRHADFYRNLPVSAGRLRRDKRTRRSPPDASTGLHVRVRR